jgi:hypothetical protein
MRGSGAIVRLARRAGAAIATSIVCGLLAAPAGAFEAGAAKVDITPPAWTAASDAAFVPLCGTTPAQVAELWPGPRQFAFEKPYVDSYHLGRFAPGDPYCDANHSGRYEAPYLAGGSGQNRWPTSVDPGNGPGASAIVLSSGTSRDAVVSVDSIGLFDVTMEQIRERVREADPAITHVFISSTHDESAPDPIGLWGPNTTEVNENTEAPFPTSSGVDQYYMRFLAERVAGAVVSADHARRRASLYASIGSMPANTQSCWSSYPYIDDQRLPVLQARDGSGQVIFTLADVGTHAETLAFSHVAQYTDMVSADWPGRMRADLEARWPGSVGVEVAGMVGSVETPTVYEPESTQVQRVPGALHGVAGNPDGCSSVYPDPTSGSPVADAHEFLGAYGQSVADAVAAALGPSPAPLGSTGIKAQQQSLCVALENNYFAAAFAAGLFPERPRYSDSGCTVETKPPVGAAGVRPGTGASTAASTEEEAQPNWLKSAVGVLTVGPVQLTYSPGEVFPFTESRGPIDEAQMPFPTNCYEPTTENYNCGSPLPMTPWTSAQMTRRYRFLVGLGEDMIGYIFPPGNFVGGKGEVNSQPWASYENTSKNEGHDRFGHGHADDAESVGPYSGLDVTDALQQLLASDGRGSETVPGLFVDAAGHLSDSPFAGEGFSGAVGVEVLSPKAKRPRKLLIGSSATGWAMFDGMPDSGTAGTGLAYSVSTAGVTRPTAGPLLVDVYAGARALGG